MAEPLTPEVRAAYESGYRDGFDAARAAAPPVEPFRIDPMHGLHPPSEAMRVFGLTMNEVARAIATADMYHPQWRDAARAAAPPHEECDRLHAEAMAEIERLQGERDELREALIAILTTGEYARMEAEGKAADMLGLVWPENGDHYVVGVEA